MGGCTGRSLLVFIVFIYIIIIIIIDGGDSDGSRYRCRQIGGEDWLW